jgi:hypothetical protein
LPDVLSSEASFKRSKVNSKIGYNRGIPVRWVVESLAQQGVRMRDRNPVTPAPTAVNNTADEYFIAGFNKVVEPGEDVLSGKKQAIQLLTQSIRLNPRYTRPYFTRAIAYVQLREYQLAFADDRSGGIADVRKAAELAKAQGNTQVLSTSLQLLQDWGVR